jgi:hypothetical protein
MKPDLRRIEATLGQIQGMTEPQSSQGRSRTLEVFPLPKHSPEIPAVPKPIDRVEQIQPPLLKQVVQPFPVQHEGSKAPVLPRSKPPSITHHRHASNPGLAVTLLQEIELRVQGWQQELEQIIQQIRSLYAEGPIVDGWLESQTESQTDSQPAQTQTLTHSIDLATLRHAETDHLLKYIEELCSVKQPPVEQAEAGVSYRLCGLNADGQLWSRACPPQQVPYVSLAIARYQKLRILFSKKQSLETRLQQLVETLTLLHSQLQEPI